MSKSPNRVTIFSNGIADFRRNVPLTAGGPTTVSIPVNKQHIGDILASLNIYGGVTLVTPPSFTNDGPERLELESGDLFVEIGNKLRGAEVIVFAEEKIEGRLVGVDSEPIPTNGEAAKKYFYTILVGGTTLRRVSQSAITKLEFKDATVKSEIEKTLNRAFQTIKPQSTNVELKLSSETGGDATIHYTIPAAAWKMTYRLRRATDGIFLDGVCVVDNTTEEDWDEFIVSVVTGEPVTFSTDLAIAKLPHRSTVNVVADQAAGGVEVEASYANARSLSKSVKSIRTASSRGAVMACNVQADASEGFESFGVAGPEGAPGNYGDVGLQADASAREVGDFSVFEHKSPLTIKAGTSASIPVFNHKLADAESVLYFKENNHPERPYRAIRFNNNTEFTLGRGVCTVIEESTYAGSAILSSCKKGEETLLCHAIDTGVRVNVTHKPSADELSSFKLGDGVGVVTYRKSNATTYAIRNKKNEEFAFVLDHQNQLANCEADGFVDRNAVETILEKEHIKNGYRFKFKLAANEEVLVTVNEELQQAQSFQIGNHHFNVGSFIFGPNNKCRFDDAQIQKCVEIQGSINDLALKIRELDGEFNTLQQEQNRLHQMIKSDPEAKRYKDNLRDAEDRLQVISKKEKPTLVKDQQKLVADLGAAIKELSYEWAGDGEKKKKKTTKK